ncbi:MAG: AAA family ATPase, partial [Methylobacter sp.]|nr:AAA family ATPase [Methylobacter sp.]
MTTHITLRLAWHNDGWNGHICKQPEKNTYCVGCASYPGEMIREQRNLEWEKQHSGNAIADLDTAPACMYSASAFSDRPNRVQAEPPDFFNDDTETKYWEIPAATACTWPYEAMYNREGVKNGDRYNYDKRLEYAEEHFQPLEQNRSLVFYYANYSNPLSDDENRRYLLIGVARLKEIAPTLYYDKCSERTLERYKGFVWQRAITSHYPEQGIRLPYHRYLDKPSILQKFAAYSENQNICKYATKQVSDDEALGLLEQLLESARIIRDDVKDKSENWTQRIEWLESLIAELWSSRGAYPGMPAVLQYLGLEEAVSGFRAMVEQGKEQQAVEEIKTFIDGKSDSITDFSPQKEELVDCRRSILLEAGDFLDLLTDVLARCALSVEQLKAIVSNERESVGITASMKDIEKNPYLLAEQFKGIDSNNKLRWSVVDRGMIPSPELFAEPLFKKNSKERLRSLLLETIRGNTQQTFVKATMLIEQVNRRIRVQPEWKQNLLTEQYLKVDSQFYAGAIYQRSETGEEFLYALDVWNDERNVQKIMDQLLIASDISLPRPVGDTFWEKVLYRQGSELATNAADAYRVAIDNQKQACNKIINKRFGAITGGAGTGKSTVVAALIKAIRKVHGDGTGVAVIAPTGKATDRLRRAFVEADLTSVSTSTIHSILAKHGWLNNNMSFRLQGGKRMSDYSTIFIDESSMIDLSLMAALFRAIDWNAVSRLILVGDAAQLPPIGIGKVYADVVTYLRKNYPDHLVELTENLRQMESRVSGRGNGILSLASCFINSAVKGECDETELEAVEREKLITRLHEGGEVDKDLKIVYWDDPEQMQESLINVITDDLRTESLNEKTAAQVWGNRLKDDVNVMQILSPVRGELHGTESINQKVQQFKSEYWLKKGYVDGITMFDKVIQINNRPPSNPITAYNYNTKKEEKIEVFNGEIGAVTPKGYEWKTLNQWNFRVKDISVKFAGKDNYLVNYFGRAIDKPEANLELAYAISVHKAQ